MPLGGGFVPGLASKPIGHNSHIVEFFIFFGTHLAPRIGILRAYSPKTLPIRYHSDIMLLRFETNTEQSLLCVREMIVGRTSTEDFAGNPFAGNQERVDSDE